MQSLLKQKTLLILFIIIGSLARFYNLNWGAPFYFHPDERNIASAISQLSFPSQLNPHFFAYGSFPIYLAYLTGLIQNFFTNTHISFEHAILLTRTYASLLSVAIIPFLYGIGTKIKNTLTGVLASFLGTMSVGFIQFAHFGTFEMWLTFLSLLLFYCCIKIIQTEKYVYGIFSGIVAGLLIGTKISSFILFPLPVIAFFIPLVHHKISVIKRIRQALLKTMLYIIVIFFVFFATNPFVFFAKQDFLSSMHYETSVALGTEQVFYTQEFFHTFPMVFQFTRVYPFLLNPLITIIFIPSLLFVIISGIKRKNYTYLLLAVFYLLLFLSQATVFVKWTRYMLPTLPFMYLIIAITLADLVHHHLRYRHMVREVIIYAAIGVILVASVLYGTSYTVTAFTNNDTRIAASTFASKHIPSSANILGELYDLGIVPFNQYFSHIKLFDFYDLDQSETNSTDLASSLVQADYIILPSQRVVKIRLLDDKNFPQGYRFYTQLFNGELGFKEIYETSCDLFCRITYAGDPIMAFEETANVFDRPTVFIFQKERSYDKNVYKALIQ